MKLLDLFCGAGAPRSGWQRVAQYQMSEIAGVFDPRRSRLDMYKNISPRSGEMFLQSKGPLCVSVADSND